MVKDAASQSFRTLPKQIRGCTAQNEEASPKSWPVNQNSKDREKIGQSLNLINDHQPLKPLKRQHGVAELCKILWVFQIVIEDWFIHSDSHLTCKGCLAHLPCPNNAHHRMVPN